MDAASALTSRLVTEDGSEEASRHRLMASLGGVPIGPSPSQARLLTSLKTLARVELLILDDWGLANATADQGRDLLEIHEDRHGRGSTIVTSQVDVKHWHEMIANPTVADAILDRLDDTSHQHIRRALPAPMPVISEWSLPRHAPPFRAAVIAAAI